MDNSFPIWKQEHFKMVDLEFKIAFQIDESSNLKERAKNELECKYFFLSNSIQRHCSPKAISNLDFEQVITLSNFYSTSILASFCHMQTKPQPSHMAPPRQ